MKIKKSSISLIIILSGLLMDLYRSNSLSLRSKYKRNFSAGKILKYNSKNEKNNQNLQSLNLSQNGNLIANCDEHTILTKLIFSRDPQTNILDVGFNCRVDKNVLSRVEHKDAILTFDTSSNVIPGKNGTLGLEYLTPPNIECSSKMVLFGFEIKKLDNKIQFIWHCREVRDFGNITNIKSNSLYYKNNIFKEFDKKKLFDFLSHTNIAAESQDKEGIKAIEFKRSPDKQLSYSFTLKNITSGKAF